MHVWIMKPIEFMDQYENGFIPIGDCVLVYKGALLSEMKMFVYIRKFSTILGFESEGYFQIKKIGETLDGNSFFIEFPQNVYYPFVNISEIKEEEYLSPVEINFTIPTKDYIEQMKTNYSNFGFVSLIAIIWNNVESTDFVSQKDKVVEMIKHIPTALDKFMKTFDDEALVEFREEWEINLEKEKDNSSNGERKKVSIKIYNLVIALLKKEENRREEIIVIKKEIDDMDLDSLKEEQQKSLLSEDYERATLIRDKIREMESAQN